MSFSLVDVDFHRKYYRLVMDLVNTLLSPVIQRLDPQKSPSATQLLFNPKQLVVLRNSVGAGGRARLDLPRTRSYCQVRDKSIFAFAGTMRDHRRVSIAPCQIDSIERFTDGADLVQLDKNRVSNSVLNPLGKNFNVRDEDVIAHKLNLVSEFLGQD